MERYDLPKGWELKRLGNLCRLIKLQRLGWLWAYWACCTKKGLGEVA